ncbi:MAG: peptidylprolyl isomerase, partial [Bacteroidales bacterium]|nr:peptidylprolyl isomerase [Bacteroidales bacterium]
MALIGDIRKRSGLLIVIIGVALAAFVLGDLLTKGPKKQEFNVGVIDGEEIPMLTFNQRVEDNLGYRRQSLNRENLTSEEQYSVRQSTWEEMLNEILMNKQFSALGMTVSTEELDELIRGVNPHSYIQQSFTDPNTGVFNPELVDNFLRNLDQVDPSMRKRYLYIEKAVKNDRLSTKYRNLVSRAYYMPAVIAKSDHKSKNRQLELRSVVQRYQLIPDEQVILSDKDLKDYYEKNKYRFKQPDELRSIDYVIFEVQPSEDDREQISKEIQEIYEEFQQAANPGIFVNSFSDKRYDSSWFGRGALPLNIEEPMFESPVGTIVGPFMEENKITIARLVDMRSRPDSMKASHILISFQGTDINQEITRTKERAQQIADSLLTVVQRNRAMFKTLASTMSDDPSAAQRAGDLNWFADGAMVHPFNEAVLNGRVGDILKVETRFGFHIVEITGKKEAKPKVRVAIVERAIEPSTRTIQEAYVKASQFAGTNHNTESFEKAVVEMGLSKRSADDIRPMDNSIPGISAPREIIRWMFSKSIKKGDVSAAFDLDGSFVVAILRETKNKGTIPFEQSKIMIEPLARREKKAEILISKFEEAAKNGTDLISIALKLNAPVDTINYINFNSMNLPRYGREPGIVGKIFGLKQGEISKPLKGDLGVYMVQIDNETY